MKKLSIFAGLIAIVFLFGIISYTSTIEIKDLDLWLHLGMGKFIVEHGFVPKVDILSCTFAGKPWVNHEWLFQVLVYDIYRVWGPDGLTAMQSALAILTMGILLLIGYNPRKQLNTIFILLITLLVYQTRFTYRPDLFSLLFFAMYIYILSHHIDKRWPIVALFLIQVVWSNFHGFFFFGPLFILIGLVSEWMKRHIPLPYEWNKIGRLTNDEYRRMKWILGTVIVGCLFNPMTFLGAWYPIYIFTQITGESKIFFEHIQELQRPITRANIFDPNAFGFYKLLICLTVFSFIFNRRKIDISGLLFWFVFLVFSLSAARNLAFFAFAAYLVYITNCMTISIDDILPFEFDNQRFRQINSIALKVILIVWMVQFVDLLSLRGYFDFDKLQRKSEFGGLSQRMYPDKAVDFLVENNISGNFFNDFNSGAYLVGRCFPSIKVFIDGRTEVHGPAFFKKYQKIWGDGNTEILEEMIDKYDITGAFLSSAHNPVPKKLFNYFYDSPEWEIVYFNYDAVIFLKNVRQNEKFIKDLKLDLEKWETPKMDLVKLGAQNVTPYRHYYRAFSLESIDLDEPALDEAHEALRISPKYARPYYVIGKIFAKRKDFKKAFENFRVAAVLNPGETEIRYKLALSYYDMGEYDGAIKQYSRLHNNSPKNPKPLFMLAKCFTQKGEYPRAKNTLSAGLSLDPRAVRDVIAIGDIAYEKEDFTAAKELYEVGLGGKKEDQIRYKLGQTFEALGDYDNARREYEKGLEVNSENDEIKAGLKSLSKK